MPGSTTSRALGRRRRKINEGPLHRARVWMIGKAQIGLTRCLLIGENKEFSGNVESEKLEEMSGDFHTNGYRSGTLSLSSLEAERKICVVRCMCEHIFFFCKPIKV